MPGLAFVVAVIGNPGAIFVAVVIGIAALLLSDPPSNPSAGRPLGSAGNSFREELIQSSHLPHEVAPAKEPALLCVCLVAFCYGAMRVSVSRRGPRCGRAGKGAPPFPPS